MAFPNQRKKLFSEKCVHHRDGCYLGMCKKRLTLLVPDGRQRWSEIYLIGEDAMSEPTASVATAAASLDAMLSGRVAHRPLSDLQRKD